MNDLFNDDCLVQSPSYADVMNGTVLPLLQEKERVSVIPG